MRLLKAAVAVLALSSGSVWAESIVFDLTNGTVNVSGANGSLSLNANIPIPNTPGSIFSSLVPNGTCTTSLVCDLQVTLTGGTFATVSGFDVYSFTGGSYDVNGSATVGATTVPGAGVAILVAGNLGISDAVSSGGAFAFTTPAPLTSVNFLGAFATLFNLTGTLAPSSVAFNFTGTPNGAGDFAGGATATNGNAFTINLNATPEPGTFGLMGLALAGIAFAGRRFRRS